jgi:hypothetical protein
MQRFARWFARRYDSRKSMYMYSIGNEYKFSELIAGFSPAAQVGAVVASVTAAIREVNPTANTTADLSGPAVSVNRTRLQTKELIAAYSKIFQGCSHWCVHIYSTNGSVGNTAAAGGTAPAAGNTYGFEAAEALLSAFAAEAAAQGKRLVCGEFGVDSAEGSTDQRIQRVIRAVRNSCDYGLIWNVQHVANDQPNQVVWTIQPGTARGDLFASQVTSANAVRALLQVPKSPASPSCFPPARPEYMFSVSNGAAGRIAFPVPADTVAGSFGLMAWVKWGAAFNAFETLIDMRGSTTSGFVILGDSVPGTGWFIELRDGTGNAGNTAGVSPLAVVGETVHIAITFSAVDRHLRVFINGALWTTSVTARTMASVPAATTVFIGGNVAAQMQDVALVPYPSQADILRHASGQVLEGSAYHVRASAGGITDVSGRKTALTIGGSVLPVAVF